METLRTNLSAVMASLLFFNIGALIAAAKEAAANADGGVSVEALLNAPYLESTSLSPDGRLFVYTVCDVSKMWVLHKPPHEHYTEKGTPVYKLGCALWVADTRSGSPRKLTGDDNSWDPVWSPDGRRLAFCSDRDGFARLWTWSPSGISAEGQFRRVSEEIVHAGNRPVWTPDSNRLIAPLVPASLGFEAVTTSRGKAQDISTAWRYEGATVRIFHANAPNSTQAGTGLTPALRQGRDVESDFDLAYVDVATGKVKRVGYVTGSGYTVSPDGRQIALNVAVASTTNAWNNMQRMDVITEDGIRSTPLPDQMNLDRITWSPDGRYLAATTGKFEGSVPHLQVQFIQLKNGQRTQSTNQIQVFNVWDFAWEPNSEYIDFFAETREAPTAPKKEIVERVRAADGAFKIYQTDPYKCFLGFIRRSESKVLWSHGDSTMVFAGINDKTKNAALVGFDPPTGKFTSLREAPEALVSDIGGGQLLDVSADGNVLVMPKQSSDRPTDYYVFDRSLKTARRLTDVNPELSKVTFGKIQMIHWTGPEGMTLGGELLLPSNYVPGKRYPTILETYPGGDWSDGINYFGGSGLGYGDNFEMLATRGFAVFRAQSVVLPDGKVAQSIAESMETAAKKVIEMGIADPNNLGITGQSYGAYATLATITRSPMFKAAVVIAGPANLPGMVGALEDDTNGGSVVGAGILASGFKLNGTLWQNPKRYIENSPVFDLDKVKTAVLILHGTEDDRVPVTQGREVYADLNQLGQEVELRQYDGEQHGNSAFANQADEVYSMIHWFDDHLKNDEGSTKQSSCLELKTQASAHQRSGQTKYAESR